MILASEKDRKFMEWAIAGADTFSTCGKRQYMALIVDDNGHLVAMGYNGTPKGTVHCKDGGCPRLQEGSASGSVYSNCTAIHAELNALVHSNYTAYYGKGCTLYVNGPPCWDCGKAIANSGISRVVYLDDPSYEDFPRVRNLLAGQGIICIALERNPV